MSQVKTNNRKLLIPIECKKAYVAKKNWVFFEDAQSISRLVYQFNGKSLQVTDTTRSSGFKICTEGIEIDTNKADPYKAASVDNIWKAAFQCCKGGIGFLVRELEERTKQSAENIEDFEVILLLITNAKLYICDVDIQAVDVTTGSYNDEANFHETPWLILQHPFTPSQNSYTTRLKTNLEEYVQPQTRGSSDKEGVIVLNSMHIVDFFKMLQT